MSYFINPVGEDWCVFLSYEGETPVVELSAARYGGGRRAGSAPLALLGSGHHLNCSLCPLSLELFDFAQRIVLGHLSGEARRSGGPSRSRSVKPGSSKNLLAAGVCSSPIFWIRIRLPFG